MKKPFYKILYVQVLAAIAIDALLGHYSPGLAVKMKPLGGGFIQLIKMVIGPIIFCTVVSSITGIHDMKKVGRVGGKALLYFEVVSTFALIVGLAAGHIFSPGAGFNVDVNTIDAEAMAQYAAKVYSASTVDFLLNITPNTVVDTFAEGDILQILLIALLFGDVLSAMGERAQMVMDFIGQISHAFFRIVHVITRVAPISAFGAVAFAIDRYDAISLVPLLKLVDMFYFTAIIPVVVVLGTTVRVADLNIFRFVAYIKEELLIVLGTNSSGSALLYLMEKTEKLGCSKSMVGPVVLTGYSFNLDGTNTYMTMAMIFISQALNIELAWTQQPTILAVATPASKGALGIIDTGFITLAVTLAVMPDIPMVGMVLILGTDHFMNEHRAPTNVAGNGMACVVISTQEHELDRAKLARVLSGGRSDEGASATLVV